MASSMALPNTTSTEPLLEHILVIGPGATRALKECDLTNVKVVVFQGNIPNILEKSLDATVRCTYPDTRPAVNDAESEEFFKRLPKSCIIYVVSSKEALLPENRITEQLMEEEGHSPTQKLLVAISAFKNLWGRMNPQSIYAKYGWGLFVGKAANFIAVEELWVIMGSPKHTPSDKLLRACQIYSNIMSETTSMEIPVGFLERLIITQTRLAAIAGGIEPLDKFENLLVSSDPTGQIQYDLSKDYPDIFTVYRKIGIYSPAYDLIAAKLIIKMVGLSALQHKQLYIVTDPGQDPDDQLALWHLFKKDIIKGNEQLLITGKGSLKSWHTYLESA